MARAGVETPPYVVLKKIAQNMEIRQYLPSKWACAIVDGTPDDYRQSTHGSMFGKLFKYISGENSANQEIKMTVPVLTDFKNVTRQDSQMEMGFFVPKVFHNDPPLPVGQNMYIKNVPEMIVAVVTYTGDRTLERNLYYKAMLVQSLGEAAKDFDCVNYSRAGYNAPFDPIQTHEIWLKKLQ